MGAITTTNKTAEWVQRVDGIRNELIQAAGEGNKVAAAFATAEARLELLESLKDEEIRAKLLRMTDPNVAMVELANNPSDEDRVRWCAIAILSGFCPGEDQFAIFGGKGGKLYTKEAGFRKLFAHLGVVPEMWSGHPEYVAFGTGGKKVWRVSGKASCVFRGVTYVVDCTGQASVGIPGNDTDNVAAVQAKARRRLLQQLWAKVSPILTDEHSDFVDVIQEPPPAIEHATSPPQPSGNSDEIARQAVAFEQTLKGIQNRVKNPEQLNVINGLWARADAAKGEATCREIIAEARSQVRSLGQNNVDEIIRYCSWVAERLQNDAVAE